MNFRFSKSKTVGQNLQMFNTLTTNLSESGVTLEQEVKVGQLLNALPSSWDPLKMGWAARTETDRNIAQLIGIRQKEPGNTLTGESIKPQPLCHN